MSTIIHPAPRPVSTRRRRPDAGQNWPVFAGVSLATILTLLTLKFWPKAHAPENNPAKPPPAATPVAFVAAPEQPAPSVSLIVSTPAEPASTNDPAAALARQTLQADAPAINAAQLKHLRQAWLRVGSSSPEARQQQAQIEATILKLEQNQHLILQ